MKLPESWADVTIAQYHKLIAILNLYKHEEDAIERQIKLLSLFSCKTEKEIQQLNISELIAQAKQLQFLNELPTEGKLAQNFKLKDKTYKAVLINADMKAGQFIDFSHAGKECSPEELPYHMHELIACMCLTEKEGKWIYEGYNENSDDFLALPMSIAYQYYLFFCKVFVNLQMHIQESSPKNLMKMFRKEMMEVEKILKSN